jgi:hypothetical protein
MRLVAMKRRLDRAPFTSDSESQVVVFEKES